MDNRDDSAKKQDADYSRSKANAANIRTTENQDSGVSEKVLVILSIILVCVTFPLSMIFCLTVVKEYQRAVIFRLGRLKKGGARGPGIFFILVCIEEYMTIDLRIHSFDVPTQEILTKDSVTVQLDAVVYFRIKDPLKAVIQVENVFASTQLLAQTTLRNVSGTRMLMELLSARDSIAQTIAAILDEGTDPWGVQVERVEIKDVRLPLTLQRAMAAEAEAVRMAKAKIVAAEGELNASRALKEASDVMSQNPISLQLRYLQTLTTIASERNSTIIFPFPIDILTPFKGP